MDKYLKCGRLSWLMVIMIGLLTSRVVMGRSTTAAPSSGSETTGSSVSNETTNSSVTNSTSRMSEASSSGAAAATSMASSTAESTTPSSLSNTAVIAPMSGGTQEAAAAVEVKPASHKKGEKVKEEGIPSYIKHPKNVPTYGDMAADLAAEYNSSVKEILPTPSVVSAMPAVTSTPLSVSTASSAPISSLTSSIASRNAAVAPVTGGTQASPSDACPAFEDLSDQMCMLQARQDYIPCSTDSECFIPSQICCRHYCGSRACKYPANSEAAAVVGAEQASNKKGKEVKEEDIPSYIKPPKNVPSNGVMAADLAAEYNLSVKEILPTPSVVSAMSATASVRELSESFSSSTQQATSFTTTSPSPSSSVTATLTSSMQSSMTEVSATSTAMPAVTKVLSSSPSSPSLSSSLSSMDVTSSASSIVNIQPSATISSVSASAALSNSATSGAAFSISGSASVADAGESGNETVSAGVEGNDTVSAGVAGNDTSAGVADNGTAAAANDSAATMGTAGSETQCPSRTCTNTCVYGRKVDALGCSVCDCMFNDKCPRVLPIPRMLCLVRFRTTSTACDNDQDCPQGHICCPGACSNNVCRRVRRETFRTLIRSMNG